MGDTLTSRNERTSFGGGGGVRVVASNYGVSPDNPDNATALNALITQAATPAADGSAGNIIDLPHGVIKFGSQIVNKNKVRLRGAGKRPTILQAIPGFPTSTAGVRLGDGTGIVFDCRLEDLSVDMNNVVGSTGVYSTEANEGSGLFHCVVQNYKNYGIDFEAGVSIICMDDLEVFPASAGSTAGIMLNGIAGGNAISNVTVAVGSGTHDDGIRAVNCQVLLSNIHVEGHTDGIDLSGGNGTVTSAHGHPLTTNLVHIRGDTKDFTCLNLTKNGSTYSILDDFIGAGGMTDDFIRFYSQYEIIVSGMRFTDRWIDFNETGDPSAGAANHARLYARDNGSGKTQLVVRFPTGAVQVIATEP